MADNKKKILIIEDDQMIGSMYRTKLEQENFIVLTATNGAQGLELALNEKPDLVMLDIIMPQLDGFSVLRQLRENEGTKNTPIIMLTNLGTDEDKDKGQKLGATDYLIKANLTPAQISEIIKKYIK
jgi:DNA-binding response OmpR family regulator